MSEDPRRITSPDQKVGDGLEKLDNMFFSGKPQAMVKHLNDFKREVQDVVSNAQSCYLTTVLRAYRWLETDQHAIRDEATNMVRRGLITRQEMVSVSEVTDDVVSAMADVIVDRLIKNCACKNE